MFKAGEKGFQITFENGYTVSVQFGIGNYCENRSYASFPNYSVADREAGERGSRDAEVAVWNAAGEWESLSENDTVIGWQSPEEVLAILSKYASL